MNTHDAEKWTSRALPQSTQFRGFQQVFERTHFHWDLKRDNRDTYLADVHRRSMDQFVFTQIEADPLSGARTASDIKLCDDHYFCLLYLDKGASLLGQGGNESELRAGSVALWDSTRPAFFNATERLHQYSLLIPHEIGTMCLPGIEDLCGLEVGGEQGMGALLLSHLKQLHATIDSVEPRDRPAILRATVELAAAAFRPDRERVGGTAFRRALLARVQEYIIDNLGDPELGPQSIAAAFRFSPRYLHRLFHEFDITVADWVKRRRLFRSRTELEDAGMDGHSITQIAMKNGFSDGSHFSRTFRAEFGVSPREHRYQAKLLRDR